MSFRTRQELIRAGKWPVATLTTEEHGDIRLAKLTADGSLRLEAARGATGERLEREREASAITLEASCIDAEGAPLFASVDAAKQFMGTISPETFTALVVAIAGVSKPKPKTPGGDEGNAQAGPG